MRLLSRASRSVAAGPLPDVAVNSDGDDDFDRSIPGEASGGRWNENAVNPLLLLSATDAAAAVAAAPVFILEPIGIGAPYENVNGDVGTPVRAMVELVNGLGVGTPSNLNTESSEAKPEALSP